MSADLTPEALPPPDSRSELVRHTAVMSVGTALSRITGFLRLAAIAYALGAATRLADSYTVANTTPNIVYELVLGGILTSVFVPVFVEWIQTKGREESWAVARAVMTIALVVLTAIMIVSIAAAPWIASLYTVGVPAPQRAAESQLATFFLRWFMPQIVFYGLGAVAIGLLNAHRRFAVPMFAPILNNLIVIATMVAFALLQGAGSPTLIGISDTQKYVLAIGTTLGVIAMTVALWPSLRAIGFRFSWRLEWRHPAVRRIARLAIWTFVYVLANQAGLIVVIILGLGPAGYNAYTSAFILFQLPYAIFGVSIFTALLPAMSSRWTDRDTDGFRTFLGQGLRSTAFIVVPAALAYIVLAYPIVRLLLQHGRTTADQALLVAAVLKFFSLGLFSFAAFQLLLRAFYSMQDTRTPALINIAAVTLNTAVNFLFFFTFDLGVRGLALGHATGYTFATIVSIAVLRKRLGRIGGRTILAGISKALIAGIVTAAAAWLTSEGLAALAGVDTVFEQSIQVLGSVVVGLLVFLGMAVLLRMEELELLRSALRTRFRP